MHRTLRPRGTTRAPGERRSPARLALFGVAGLLVAAVVWFFVSLFQPGKGAGEGAVAVRVPPGVGAGEVGDLLARRGVVSSGFFFSLRATLSGKRGGLHPGSFALKHDMSYAAALDVLTTPAQASPTVAITIPEGRSIRQEVGKLAGAGVRGYGRAARDLRLLNPRRYGAPASTRTLEGFLFPATYTLRRPPRARALVVKQLAAFRQNLRAVDLRAARRKHLTVYDVLIIASMVEGEARVPRDRAKVSAVIYNRLKAGKPLEIDATIAYANHSVGRALTRSQLAADGPYNTYKHTGLPPTPIGNPGRAAIEAAAHPAKAPYRYYVVDARNPCTHVFSASYARFLAAQAAYRRASESGKLKTVADCTGR